MELSPGCSAEPLAIGGILGRGDPEDGTALNTFFSMGKMGKSMGKMGKSMGKIGEIYYGKNGETCIGKHGINHFFLREKWNTV
jgi:hypothetical protein